MKQQDPLVSDSVVNLVFSFLLFLSHVFSVYIISKKKKKKVKQLEICFKIQQDGAIIGFPLESKIKVRILI